MRHYKQRLVSTLVIFIIILIFNYIYIKMNAHNFCLNELKTDNLLVLDSVIVFIILKKGKKTFFYGQRLENHFFDSSKEQNDKYEMLLDCIDVGYAYYRFIKVEEGNVVNSKAIEVNKALESILGETRESMLSYSFSDFWGDYIGKEYDCLKVLEEVQKNGKFKVSEYINIDKDKWIGFSIYRIKKEDFVVIIIDVSESRKYIEEMKYLANYDSLTNLKNRYSIYNYLAELKRKRKEFAILFVDLDDFGKLNDNLGHDLGDEVLHRVAFNLRKYENNLTKIGRLGGDEFLIILEEDTSKEYIENFGRAILKSLDFDFTYNSYSYPIKASIGVSIFERDSDNIVTLVKYADIAMYHSKNRGGNQVAFFKGEMLENEIKKMC